MSVVMVEPTHVRNASRTGAPLCARVEIHDTDARGRTAVRPYGMLRRRFRTAFIALTLIGRAVLNSQFTVLHSEGANG